MTDIDFPRVSGQSDTQRVLRLHPLAAFFTVAYGLTWLAWLPYVFPQDGLGVLPFGYPMLLGTTQLLGVLAGAYLGPVTAALVVTALTEGRRRLRAWRGRLLRVRVRWTRWVAVAGVVPLAIIGATFLLPGAVVAVRAIWPVLLLVDLPMLALPVMTTAFAEEPGWRDFALPRLQGSHRPLLGPVVLGLLWGCWHLPLFPSGGWPHASLRQPVIFVAGCVPLSLVMTWVLTRTGQSVPLVMLPHASINSTYSLVWPPLFPALHDAGLDYPVQLVATLVATLVLLVATPGRLGLPVRLPAIHTAEPQLHPTAREDDPS